MLKAIHACEDRQAARDKAEAVIEKLRVLRLKEAAQRVGGVEICELHQLINQYFLAGSLQHPIQVQSAIWSLTKHTSKIPVLWQPMNSNAR